MFQLTVTSDEETANNTHVWERNQTHLTMEIQRNEVAAKKGKTEWGAVETKNTAINLITWSWFLVLRRCDTKSNDTTDTIQEY